MRVVFYTNIIISGLLFSGKQRILLRHVIEHAFELIISHPIIEEINDVIGRDKFKVHRELSVITVAELIELAKLVFPTTKVNIVKTDPDDNMIIECAIEGKAQYIITGGSDHRLHVLVANTGHGLDSGCDGDQEQSAGCLNF
ncbi:MAG: putative toxin-antitoxin system toxin component, PIN family [Leptospirales bacterium]